MSDLRLPNVKTPIKRARPAILKRRTTAGDSSPKQSLFAIDETASGPETSAMATSFLQYCANCERQIMTPHNSILYCSESCRRKDTKKAFSIASPAAMYMTSPINTPPPSKPSSPRPILPPRVPSGPAYSHALSIRIPTELHNSKSDLDPTEWKPKLNTESEAYRYLSQFHNSTTAIAELNATRERPHFQHANTIIMNGIATPSLANSLNTNSSSWSPTGDYDFNTRPLQPRHNPIYSASAGMTRGIDLVTPHIAPAPQMADSVPSMPHGTWERKVVVRVAGTDQDGLGVLFGRASLK